MTIISVQTVVGFWSTGSLGSQSGDKSKHDDAENLIRKNVSPAASNLVSAAHSYVSVFQRQFSTSVVLFLCVLWGSLLVLPSSTHAQEPSPQLRLLQPSKGERLTPGGEYLILWSGISPQDTVQLSYTIDSGKTWQLITPAASGLAYRWSPIPTTASESCLISVSTKPRDNSVLVQSEAYALRYGVARPSQRWLNRWSGFNFDGSKILTIASLPFDDSTRQTYRTEVWEASSGRVLFRLPDYLADTNLRFAPTGITPRSIQAQWSPDLMRLLNVLSDTTFGVFDASTGRLLRTIRIPREGFAMALQSVGWSTDGREIIARLLVREQGLGGAGTVLSDKLLRFSLSDLSDRPLGAQFSKIEFDQWGSTYLGLMNNKRQWLAMRRRNGVTANAPPIVQEILLYTPGMDSARRFTPPANYAWQAETLLVAPNDSLMALVAVPINPLQNTPNFLTVVNLFTGMQRTRSAASPVSWSPDNRTLILLAENTKQPELFDTEAFSVTAVIQNLYVTPAMRALRTGNIISEVVSGSEQIRWSNNGRSFIGYEASSPYSSQPSINAQALGFWDAAIGCQTERFSLPRLPGMAEPLRYNLSAARGFVANVTERQYIVANTLSDTTFVLTLQPPAPVCQSAFSNGFWSIRLPNVIVAQENITVPTIICETSATARFTVTNLTNSVIILESALQSLSGNGLPPSDFSLVQTTSRLMPARAVETVILSYTPQKFGDTGAQVVFTDQMNNVLARTIVLARKDSLALDPPAPFINFGLVPAKTILTTTVTIRNTGNTPLVWSTAATRSTLGNVFITQLTPNPTPVGASAQVTVRVQPIESLGIFREILPIYFCGSSTSTAFIQARVLSEFQQINTPALVDGGTLTCASSIQRSVRIQNIGGKPLTISSIGDENFTIENAPTLPFTLLPLDSLVVGVRLASQTNGVRESRLVIRSNDPFRQSVDVVLRVQRLAPIYIWTPSLLRFDRTDIGLTTERTIEFANNAQNPLFWDSLPRRITPDFTILNVQPNPTPNGSKSLVTIRFNGSPVSGLTSTIANFNLRDICNTQTQLPLEAITIQPAPKVIVRSIISFDTLLCETERMQEVQILNAGRRTLRIDSAFIEPSIGAGRSMATDFILRTENTPPFPATIAGVDSSNSVPLQLFVSFRPRGTGIRENWLVVYSNDTTTSANGIVRVRLSGVSEMASFLLSPPVLRFPTLTDFTPVRDTVFITNTGTKPLVWQNFPRVLDSLFTIERIDPAITAPGGISKAIVRFAGIRRTDNIGQDFTLTSALCSVSQTIRFVAGTAPQGTLGALRDASVRLLCENERRIVIPLENIGTAALTLTSQFLNDTLREASILAAPTNIAAGKRDSLTIVLRPQNVGMRVLRLQIMTNDPLIPRTELRIFVTKDSSALRFVPRMLDVGNLSNGMTILRSITIENLGTIEQHVSLPLQAGNLVVEALSTNPIPAGGRATAQISFTFATSAAVNGILTDSISVHDSCARQSTFSVRAQMNDGEFALPDSIRLAPLGEIDVPILLRRRSGIAANTTATFRLRIANTSLLQVLSPLQMAQGVMQNRVENGARVLHFSLNVPSANESDPLVTLRLRGLLGNDSATTITLDSAFVGGLPVRGAQSRFQTLGLNYSGGKPRLYFTPLITLVAPNPASDELSVKLAALQPSAITLRLVNVLGQAVELFAGSIDAGERDFRFALSALPTGTYLLELCSTTYTNHSLQMERTTKRLQIVR